MVFDALRNNREEKLSLLFKSFGAKINDKDDLLRDASGKSAFNIDLTRSTGITRILARYIYKTATLEDLTVIRQHIKGHPDYLATFQKLHGYHKFTRTLRKLYTKLEVIPIFDIRNIDRKYIENTINLVIFLANQNAADLERLAKFNDCICDERLVLIAERDAALGKLAEIKKVLDTVEQ